MEKKSAAKRTGRAVLKRKMATVTVTTKGYTEGRKFTSNRSVCYFDAKWFQTDKALELIEKSHKATSFTISELLALGIEPKNIRITFSIYE